VQGRLGARSRVSLFTALPIREPEKLTLRSKLSAIGHEAGASAARVHSAEYRPNGGARDSAGLQHEV
jgi:hypothetical protein